MAAVKKKKKKLILIIAVLVVAAGAGAYWFMGRNQGPSYPMVETVALEKVDLQNAVDVTGTVESTENKKVFSKLTYPVESLMVEIGDRVNEGDILCQLETRSLEATIQQQSAAISKSQQSANISLSDAQKSLEDAREALEKDLNSQLLNAQSAVRQAEANLDQAALGLLDDRRVYNDARDREDSDDIIEQYKSANLKSQASYDNAKLAVEDAKAALKATEESVRRELERFESSVTSAQVGTNFSDQWIAVENLKKDLENCTITAPVSGMVTAVYAVEGAASNGLMFVIEDTDSLKVTTRIKEYDIGNVKLGDAVEIKSDATGDEVYEGRLTKIAPTSVKNAQGESDTSADTEFEAEVEVLSKRNSLKIGMKTRMDIIYEKRSRVYAVPYDAVTANEEGEEIVYVAREDETGAYFARAVVVETGMENDFDTEITSNELQDGDLIIVSIDGIAEGMQVTLMPSMGDMPAMPGGGMVVFGRGPGG